MEKIKGFLFTNINTKQTVLKNTFWLLVSEFGMRILKFTIFVYVIRKLGAAEWGLFSYAFAIMGIFGLLSDIGINAVLLKETSKNSEMKANYISTGFFLKLFLSISSSLALILLLLVLPTENELKSLIPFAAILLFIDSLREFGFSLNRAFEKMELEAFTRIGTTALLIALSFMFINKDASAVKLFYAYICSSIVGLFLMYLSLKKQIRNIISGFKKELVTKILKESWPIGLATGLGALMINTDTVILGWFENTQKIGIYSTAQKINQIIYLFPVLTSVAMLPAFVRLANSNLTEMRKKIIKITTYSLILTIPILIGCLFLGQYIFLILFGPEYAESVLIFKIMSVTILTVIPSSIISNAMFAEGNQKKMIPFVSITLTLNIILCLISIPKYGIIGAAVSMSISYTIGNILLIINYIGRSTKNI